MIALLLAPAILQDPAALVEKLRSDAIEEREEAARKLKDLGPAAVPALEKAAKDADAEVAAQARRLIGLIRLGDALTPRLRRALPDAEIELAEGGDRAWTEVFLKAMEYGGDADAIALLHPELGWPDLDPLIARALRGAATDEERVNLCGTAGNYRLRSAVPALIAAVDSDADPVVRAAVQALGELRAVGAADRIRRALPYRTGETRLHAALALARMGMKEAVPELVEELGRGSASANLVARVLGDMDVREALPGIVGLLKGTNPTARGYAVLALGHMGAKEALPGILRVLAEDAPQWTLVFGIGELGAPEALPGLLKWLDQGGSRVNAAWALGNLGNRDAIPVLLKLLDDGEDWVRGNSMHALGDLGAREAIPKILERMRAGNAADQESAAWTLWKFREKSAVGELAPLLESKERDTRAAAARVLGWFGASEAIPALLKLLRDAEPSVRELAAAALCVLGRAEGAPVLLDEQRELSALNAIRDPAGYRRLIDTSFKGVIRARSREAVRRLAAEARLELALPAACPELEAWDLELAKVRSFAGAMSLIEAFEVVLTGEMSFILEPGRIRIVTFREALAFWRKWWEERKK